MMSRGDEVDVSADELNGDRLCSAISAGDDEDS